jgi:hypothetical protein
MSTKTEQQMITEGVFRLLSETKDRVMFRRYTIEPHNVFAVFPDRQGPTKGHLSTAENTGHQSSGHFETIRALSTPVDATHPDAESLAMELASKGYSLDPIHPTEHDQLLTNLPGE